jgi:hypothetical protein
MAKECSTYYHESNIEGGPDTLLRKMGDQTRRCFMSDLHLKDVKDDLIHEPGWVYLYAALFIGIVAFALYSGGFMG